MLLEGLIAIVIFSLGVLAIVGMQASMVRASSDAKYRVDASFLANQKIGQMWGNRAALASYHNQEEDVGLLPSGKRRVSVSGDRVTVTVTWQMAGESKPHSHTSVTRING